MSSNKNRPLPFEAQLPVFDSMPENIFSSLSPIPTNLNTPTILISDEIRNINKDKIDFKNSSNSAQQNENHNHTISNSEPNTEVLTNVINDIHHQPTQTQNSQQSIPSCISSSTSLNLNENLELLKQLRSKYTNNPSIGYLNINSLRGNKFSQLEQICHLSEIDILCIDETKLTSEIPTSRLHINGY